METAVNLVQDIAPLLGERGLVFGQGIVGLLAASLLAEFPLESLVSADNFPLRRDASLKAGAVPASTPPRRISAPKPGKAWAAKKPISRSKSPARPPRWTRPSR
jgi:threonine dehydrogenase-like Zn-dependent dehydrogenase